MRVVLDACVLFPPVLRDILLGAGRAGLFRPLWSERILEEWARATRRLGPAEEAAARGAAARMRAEDPAAMVPPAPEVEARLRLPDAGDAHVLATAIAGGADAILTGNAADFPRRILAAEGVGRRDPDGFLWELWSHHPEAVARVLETVRAVAEARRGEPQALAPLLKRLRLGRLARAVRD